MKYVNVQDMIRDIGEEEVNRLFVEYFLFLQAKSSRFDALKAYVDVDKYLSEIESEEDSFE